MATALAIFLDRSIQVGEIEADALPPTLHHAAIYFFAVALNAARSEAPTDPQASIANYCIAADTIRATLPPSQHDRRAILAHLRRYTHFIKTLRESRELAGHEADTARELTAFFHHLASAGKSERYVRFEEATARGPWAAGPETESLNAVA